MHEETGLALLDARFIERVHTGEIDDMKTLVAGYWFAQRWPALRAAGWSAP